MYKLTNYPPLETITQVPGKAPIYGYASGGYKQVNRSDTIRRKKPSSLTETAASTAVTDAKHGSVYYSKNDYYYKGTTASLGLLGRPNTGNLYADGVIVCENKLRAKARGAGVNFAMMVAEYRQTALLFAELSSTAVKLYRNVRRGRFKQSFKGSFNSYRRSKDWLRFQYGTRPLMDDLFHSYQVLRSSKISPHRIEASHTVRDSYKKSAFYTSPTNVYHADYFAENRIRCYANVTFTEGSFFSFATQHDLTNPALLAWELIPFSFVVDWWINIGEVLESLDNSLIFSSLNGGISQKIFEITTVNGTEGYYRYDYKIRKPKAFSTFNSFTYKPSISLQHVLNGLALWRSIR